MEWKFDRPTNSVPVGEGQVVTWKTPPDGELDRFEFVLERSKAIYDILAAALATFEDGSADYSNAVARIDHLLDQSNLATTNLLDACNMITTWIEPVEKMRKAFEGKADDLLAFCRAWIAEQRDEREPSPAADPGAGK